MTTADEVAELREVIREAHEVLGDLRRATREGKELLKAIDRAAAVAVEERVKPVVVAGLEKFGVELRAAIGDATSRVYDRFDTLTALMLGEDKTAKRQGKPSLPEIVAMMADPQ